MNAMATLPAPTCPGEKASSDFLISMKELPQIKLSTIRSSHDIRSLEEVFLDFAFIYNPARYDIPTILVPNVGIIE